MDSATVVEIETLSPPYRGELKNTPEKIAKIICHESSCSIYLHSIDKDLVCFGRNSVFNGFKHAYMNHYPFTLSPDIVWLLILQGFARHVSINSEKFRNSFVNFQGKKKLTVERQNLTPASATKEDWMGIFSEINEMIAQNISKELIQQITPDFTTTTPLSLTTCHLTIMATFKEYFDYSCLMCKCGIPYVTVEGTVEDWGKIKIKFNSIRKYDLDWWAQKLVPVIDEIINTKNGNINKSFWKSMVRVKNSKGIYMPGFYDGWFTVFFPYNNKNERLSLEKISDDEEIAEEMLDIPFKLKLMSENDVEIIPLNICAGFVGLTQNPETFQLKPEMGWIMHTKNEPMKKYNCFD